MVEATGELLFREAPDYEAPADVESAEPESGAGDNEYVVVVEVRSGEGERERRGSRAIRVRVADEEEPPEITSGGAFEVVENRTRVGQLEAVDGDEADEIEGYAIAGGADGGLFAVVEETGELRFREAPDYENPGDVESGEPASVAGDNEYVVVVEVRSGEGERERRGSRPIRVRVTDEEEPPEITSGGAFEVVENRTRVGQLEAVDPDEGDEIEGYGIAGGADGALFAVEAETGELRFREAPDYENPGDVESGEPASVAGDNEYVVVVEVRSGEGERERKGERVIRVRVTDEEEPPEITSGGAFEVVENRTRVGQLEAVDPDEGDEIEGYGIAGGADGALFAVEAETGELRFREAPDYENPGDVESGEPASVAGDNEYVVVVEVRSGEGERERRSSRAIRVRVTDEEEDEAGEDETGSLFVPVILSSAGQNQSFFTSELTLTNRGAEEATLHYTYTAHRGEGSGTATDRLAPGRQRIKPDAIGYLTGLGISIPGSGNRIGTLRVEVSGSSEVSVVTRTTTAVPDGRAGLAYPGIAEHEGFQEAVYLCGLRQNTHDRSNVALQNMGALEDGPITLKTTLFSGEAADTSPHVVGERTLKPGEFHQYSGLLGMLGSPAQGYVKVEKIEGSAPFYAYGVINDNFNSDGSFVFPLTESSLVGSSGQTLPVIIETGTFKSELTLTNFSASDKQVDFSFVADAVETGDDTASFSLKLKAGEQTILPDIVEELRRKGVTGIGPAGRAFVGALFATAAEGDMSGIVIGARTGPPDQRDGQYSLFYNGVPYGSASIESAWIYGLQQNAENRSNLALVNTGEIDDSSSTFEITIYDGSGESQPRTSSVTLGPRRWTQENGILGKIGQGYVQVRKTSGNNPFVTYGVINDGGRPGERSGDGAFLLSQE